MSRESTPDLGLEYTVTQVTRKKQHQDYIEFAKKQSRKGNTFYSKEQVNELLTKLGKTPDAERGGYVVNGKLTYVDKATITGETIEL